MATVRTGLVVLATILCGCVADDEGPGPACEQVACEVSCMAGGEGHGVCDGDLCMCGSSADADADADAAQDDAGVDDVSADGFDADPDATDEAEAEVDAEPDEGLPDGPVACPGGECASPWVCTDGWCLCPALEGFGLCGDVCADFTTDVNNCGRCGNLCSTMAPGMICVDGDCACPDGYLFVCRGTECSCEPI